MAAYKSITLTSDKNVQYSAEYYPHKRIVIRINGFKVVVAKPYGAEPVGGRIYTGPTVQLSTNATILTDLHKLTEMQDIIQKAMIVLNSEGDGLHMLYDFKVDDSMGRTQYCYTDEIPENVLKIHNSSKVQSRKGIPQKELTHRAVYEDEKGRKWIYLGTGKIYEKENNDRAYSFNRENSYECFIFYDSLNNTRVNKRWYIDNKGRLIVEGCGTFTRDIVETYVTKKKFIKKVSDLNWNGTEIILKGNNNINVLTFNRMK